MFNLTHNILLFGGTTEGKTAAAALDGIKLRYFYSTKTRTGFSPSEFCEYICGDLDDISLPEFIERKNIKLIINAAHPFARHLHKTVSQTSEKMKIPAIRYERNISEKISHKLVVYCDNYPEAVRELKNEKGAVFILSGAQTLSELRPIWKDKKNCFARILPRKNSAALAAKLNFPEENLILEMPTSDFEKEKKCFTKLKVKAIVTKESGSAGGQEAKIKAAIEIGAKTAVIKRPEIPRFQFTVFSPEKLIEKIREIRYVS